MSFDKGRRAREAYEARQREAQEQPMAEVKTVDERLIAILERQSENQAVHIERTAPRENPNYKVDSLFLDEKGEPYAKRLKCAIYFGPIHMNRTPLTLDEVEALNTIRPVSKGYITQTDGSRAIVDVVAREDAMGRLERLTIQAPMRKEDNAHLTYPSIVAYSTELAAQA